MTDRMMTAAERRDQSKPMTATEVQMRMEEWADRPSPELQAIYNRIAEGFLKPLCKIVVELLSREAEKNKK